MSAVLADGDGLVDMHRFGAVLVDRNGLVMLHMLGAVVVDGGGLVVSHPMGRIMFDLSGEVLFGVQRDEFGPLLVLEPQLIAVGRAAAQRRASAHAALGRI